jgi:hypothetical protein
MQRTKVDRNFLGEFCFKSAMICRSCGRKIEAYGKDRAQTEQDARDLWNGKAVNLENK